MSYQSLPALYPVFLDVSGLPCLVVGGGPVASRKVSGLVGAGAAVRVVSPDAAPELAALAGAGRVTWERRRYAPGDARGHALVFACTGVPEVDAAVAAEARGLGLWVDVAGAPELGNMILPAVHRAGSLTLAISTGGMSPSLARALRDRLAAVLETAVTELTTGTRFALPASEGDRCRPSDGGAWRLPREEEGL